MNNPLNNFDWSFLYSKYDSACKGFDPQAASLYAFESKPNSDRELYYRLIERVHQEKKRTGHISLSTYEAILYWKLYSQPAAVVNICSYIRNNQETQKRIENGLITLGSFLPSSLDQTLTAVDYVFETLERYCPSLHLRGMTASKGSTSAIHLLTFSLSCYYTYSG